MKSLIPVRFRSVATAVLLCFAVSFPSITSAQTAGIGTVVGTVANDSTGQFLRNAEVRVEGTNVAALTEADGSFRLTNVPPGPHRIIVTYAGLDPETRAINVAGGQTQRETFGLKSDIYQLQQFNVTGEREGQAKAINDQKNSDHIKSVVASDAFGDLVDSNAAELLKSLPGFAMNYAGEDAIGFTMRGQSSVNASITLDGNGITNSGFGSRALNMRNVVVNNIDSIEVNRAPNASQPANSLGGSVNLVSKSAFSQKGRRVRVDVGMNINTALHSFGATYQRFGAESHAQYPTAQVNFSDVFRSETEHPIGLTLSLLRGGRYRYNSQYTPAYTFVPALAANQPAGPGTPAIATGVTMQEASAGFKQLYYSGSLDYKFSENTTLFFRAFYQEGPQAQTYGLNHRIAPTAGNQTATVGTTTVAINGNSANFIDSRPNATPVAVGSSTGSRITKTTGYEVSQNQAYQTSFGGKSRLRELNLEYGGYYGRDYVRNPIEGITKGGTLTYDVTNVGFTLNRIQSEGNPELKQTSGGDYRNIANFGRLSWTGTTSSIIDWKWGGKLDARRDFNQLKFPILLQAGFAYDVQERANSRTGAGSSYTFGSGADGTFGTADDLALPLGQFVDDHMRGRWNMHGFPAIDPGDFIDLYKLNEYIKGNPAAATRNLVTDVTGGFNDKKFHEEIDAAYFMGTIRLGKLNVVPGVRFEKTKNRGFGYGRRTVTPPAGLTLQQQADFVRPQFFPITRTKAYDGYYGNLQARYNVTDNFILRSAYNENIGRPNFANLLPGDTVDPTARTISRTNPALEPFSAKNYDLTAEYYFSKSAGSLTASVFRKDIENYFQTIAFPLPGGNDNGYEGQYEGFLVSESRNIPATTRTEGFELGYMQSLRFLPGFLRNLTASASYTHVSATPPPGTLVATGIFPTVYNVGLTYTDNRLRVDLKYNMRKSWINSVNNTTGERTIFRDNDRTDLSVNYRLYKAYWMYFDWRNFTDEEDLRLVGSDGRVAFHQMAGMSINAGIRADF